MKRGSKMNKNEISVRELKEYFNTKLVVNKYINEYDSNTVFDIDKSYFYHVKSLVENALIVHDEEIPYRWYSEIDREDIRDILKLHPRSHIYVGGRVSVRELKKYFGVDSVSYGICGSPLKSTEIIYTYTGNHLYLHWDKIVVGIEKIPDLETEEISRDEISNSIVKELHRDTYLAEEIMDAYGLEKLLDSEGSSLKRCDIINLSEYEFIQGYWDKICYRLIHRDCHTPNEYLRISGVKGLMEKFIIEKWDGYSGQKVRTVPAKKKTYRVGDIEKVFGLNRVMRNMEFLSEDFIVDFDKYELIIPTNAEIKFGSIVPKGSVTPYLWNSIYDPHLKIEEFLEETNKEEKMVEERNPISPSYYESDKIKLRDVLDQNLSRVKDGTLAFYLGNTWKYLWRWDRKENPTQDLNKAKKYIDFAIDRLNEIDLKKKM